jgi:hypothetical protein
MAQLVEDGLLIALRLRFLILEIFFVEEGIGMRLVLRIGLLIERTNVQQRVKQIVVSAILNFQIEPVLLLDEVVHTFDSLTILIYSRIL